MREHFLFFGPKDFGSSRDLSAYTVIEGNMPKRRQYENRHKETGSVFVGYTETDL